MSRTNNQNGNTGFDRKLLRLFPRMAELFDCLADMIQRMDPRQPRSFIAKMEGYFKSFAQNQKWHDAAIQAAFRRMLRSAKFREVLKQYWSTEILRIAKQQAAVDPRYSLLLRLIAEAEAKVPLVSLNALTQSANPIESLPSHCAPVDLIEQAQRLKGEARAMVTLRALASVAEATYNTYLEAMWKLSYFRESSWPPEKPSFGNLVNAASSRLGDFPGLVDPRAGWMRNSAVHHRYEYLVNEDRLLMWDNNHPRVEVPVDELVATVRSMYLLSGPTFSRVSQLYILRSIANTGLLDALLSHAPGLLDKDENIRNLTEHEILEKAKLILDPLRAFNSRFLTPTQS